jgi:hypothetical protein
LQVQVLPDAPTLSALKPSGSNSGQSAQKWPKNVLGQFLANFWVLPRNCGMTIRLGEDERSCESVVPQSRKSRRVSPIQVAVNFGARNQHTPKAGKLSQHLSANESADCFFANAEFGSAAFHIKGLAFGCRSRIHDEATHYDSLQLVWCSAYTITCHRCCAKFIPEPSRAERRVTGHYSVSGFPKFSVQWPRWTPFRPGFLPGRVVHRSRSGYGTDVGKAHLSRMACRLWFRVPCDALVRVRNVGLQLAGLFESDQRQLPAMKTYAQNSRWRRAGQRRNGSATV